MAKNPSNKKKDLKSWFMKNIILPNNEIIDKPGYIVSKYSGKGTRCYVREVLFPEKVIAKIETDADSGLGDDGLKQVYAAGKMWGVRYGRTTGLPKKSDMPKKDFLNFLESFMKFMESEYATGASFELDHEKDRFATIYKDLMICRLNGHGQFLMGTMNGAWEHMTGKKTEAVQTSCQGRGDKKCIIECAPPSSFGKKEKVFNVKVPKNLNLEKEYFTLNTIKKAQYAKNSLLDLLTSHIISYEGGFFECNGDRFLLNEASSVYFLEKNLGKTKKGEKILFDSSYDYFMKLGKKKKSIKMAQDFLPALGWGDIRADSSGKRAFCRSYPWTGYWKETKFPILRGMLSGIVSAYADEEVIFRNAKATISSGSLDILLSGD
jgi:predicted hydrocarbon binding protein